MSAHDTPLAPPDQDGVRYRPVPGFPGYCVGDDGSIWSRQPLGRSAAPTAWRRLSCKPAKLGYPVLGLHRDGRKRPCNLHTLILSAFVGPCPPGMEARHLNDNKLDNRLCNLCWGTRRENSQDRRRNGILPLGEQNGNAKLTPAAVRAIRSRAGERQAILARDFGVARATISLVLSRKTWGHVSQETPP